MSKSKNKVDTKVNFMPKLLIPVFLSGFAGIIALVMVINPFNIVKIVKNNYPNRV